MLLWGGLAFFGLQLLLGGFMEVSPGHRDALFQRKLTACQQCLKQADPAALKVIFLGSSRTLHGFAAGELTNIETADVSAADGSPSPSQPVVAYNFGARGFGPVGTLLNLRRLLNAEVRPDLVLIEVMPPWFDSGMVELAPDRIAPGSLSFGEVQFIDRFATSRTELWGEWAWSRVFPCVAQRARLLSLVEPNLLLEKERIEFIDLDAHGFDRLDDSYPATVRDAGRKAMEHEYHNLLQNFQLGDLQCAALRQTVQLCQTEKLPCVLVYAPEGPAMHNLYPPAVLASVEQLVADLSHEFGVPVIDGRNWLPEDAFLDSHHPLRPSAVQSAQSLATALANCWPQLAPQLTRPDLACNARAKLPLRLASEPSDATVNRQRH